MLFPACVSEDPFTMLNSASTRRTKTTQNATLRALPTNKLLDVPGICH